MPHIVHMGYFPEEAILRAITGCSGVDVCKERGKKVDVETMVAVGLESTLGPSEARMADIVAKTSQDKTTISGIGRS